MAEYLVFTLCAGMAAMGDLAGHERRGTLTWPGRSAVLGLVAAAAGTRRDDTQGLARLEQLRVAVGVIDDGVPLRDYHTVETIPTAAAKRPDSRPVAILAAGRATNTAITLRDYRVGVAYAVALWGAPLDGLAEALTRPVFALYLGRKSCPLSAPPAPRRVDAAGPVMALAHALLPPFRPFGRIRLVASDERIAADDVEDTRNDVAIDRGKWHFASRAVYTHRPARGEDEA
ncbi:type I-E CRISPR-associated protein Cas5/CasD [Xanthobacter agilis]|uniref:CRISPR system Cascade subunit CasD n=1 Tax=Xanthobacter agilis TaxID=47492 RepID=A0ABU0LJS1_XANAG|nr:type I-E CRISPR-associated protein Cas5/CasD [Xanthobacter agilis]MDQ0507379.1 CRISPR system Cascade subunit CasD [Xanthobacter agilis]